MTKTHKNFKKVIVVAAVACLLAAMSVIAAAKGLFGLNNVFILDLKPRTEGIFPAIGGDVISLSGYQETVESKALAEWLDFRNEYDPDDSIILSIGNNPVDLKGGNVDLYDVYTQEMADKLLEIADKYELVLHKTEYPVITWQSDDVWAERVGGDFLGNKITAYSGYIYNDGTFQFDGDSYNELGVIDFQMRRVVHGVFDEVYINIGDISTYQEWVYITSCGVPVRLALNSYKGLVLAELGTCFITVNVLEGTDNGLTPEMLQEFADGFDFNILADIKEIS